MMARSRKAFSEVVVVSTTWTWHAGAWCGPKVPEQDVRAAMRSEESMGAAKHWRTGQRARWSSGALAVRVVASGTAAYGE